MSFRYDRPLGCGRLAIAGLLLLSFIVISLTIADHAAAARNGLIAFERSVYTSRGKSCCIRIYTMRPDGSHVRTLVPNRTPGVGGSYLRSRIFEPVFTPSGRQITFLGRFGIFTMNLDGSGLTQLLNTTDIVASPSYSPDGTMFIAEYLTGNSLFTMASDGTSPALIPGTSNCLFPSFSPDDKRILATLNRGVRSSLVTMRLDGSAVRPIAHTSMGTQGTYSPNGHWIVFTKQITRSAPLARFALYKVRANGAQLTRLGRITSLNPMRPSFSPNEKWVLFSARRSVMGYDNIYKIGSNGRRLKRLTRAGTRVSSSNPTWQTLKSAKARRFSP